MSDNSKTVWFVHCDDCTSEFKANEVGVSRIRNDHFDRRTLLFTCPNCKETTESLMIGYLI